MNVATAIRKAVPVLAEHAGIDHGEQKAWLIRFGLSRAHARDAVRFIPLAFGREILDGMGVQFGDSYLRVVGSQREERPLADEPFFHEARSLVREFSGDEVTKIAMQSAELDAVNQALNAGVSAEGLVAGPPVITFAEYEMQDSATKRPWWRFW